MARTDREVWFITGATSGLGAACAREALKAGKAVVAAGRRPEKVARVLGEDEHLLIQQMDVLKLDTIREAVDAAVRKLGKIDVLLNNAGVFYAGYFENTSYAQWRSQMDINFFGAMNVTREVLPHMRKERRGLIINTGSSGGLFALEHASVYAAANFALEGWSESLRYDVAPFGIRVMLSEPGYFRSSILKPGRVVLPDLDIEDYRERNREKIEMWKQIDNNAPGDPEKYARALLEIVTWKDLPFRFMAGADAIQFAEAKVRELQADIDRQRGFSSMLNYDDGSGIDCFAMTQAKGRIQAPAGDGPESPAGMGGEEQDENRTEAG